MNTYRFDEEKRKQWVRDKFSRQKTVKEICREASISRATLYNWIDEFKYIEEEVKAARELKSPTPRHAPKTSRPDLIQKAGPEIAERYKMLVSALAGVDPSRQFSKKIVAALIKRYTLTVAQACAIAGMDEAQYGYKPRKPEAEDYLVYEALVAVIHEDRSREFEDCYKILLQQHPDWTRKQIKRVYRDGMVYLERKRSNTRWEKVSGVERVPKEQPDTTLAPVTIRRKDTTGTAWNIALLEGRFAGNEGGVWWILCLLADGALEPVNAECGIGKVSIDDVLRFLERAAVENGLPKKLRVPGKEVLTARELTRWVWQHKMALHTFSLNKPENLQAIDEMENNLRTRYQPDGVENPEELERQVGVMLAGSIEHEKSVGYSASS